MNIMHLLALIRLKLENLALIEIGQMTSMTTRVG